MKNDAGTPAAFGQFHGETVHQVTLGTPDGLQAQVMTWGAVLTDLSLPLATGGRQRLTLGFDTFDPYPAHSPYFGAVVGRYANRIAGGRFSIAGRQYHLDRNEAGQTTLHGGANGFARRVWRITDLSPSSVTLRLTSVDGDQGFPGTVQATCTYAVTDHQLEVRFRATTDQPTPVNLAHHAYFNLDGGPDTSDHTLQIFAGSYTPAGTDQIPTGSIDNVEDIALDFRQPRPLRQLSRMFDHNFVLSASPGEGLRPAARLVSLRSGIGMTVETTKPGLQFYDGGHVNVPAPGHDGRVYGARAGLCLETQFYPDGPNQPGFPDTILRPDGIYAHRTVFSFERRGAAAADMATLNV